MNSSADSSQISSDSTSWRSSSSFPQTSCKNIARCSAATFNEAWYNSSTRCQRSGSMVLVLAEITQEPDSGQFPVSHHCLVGHLQYFRSFLDAETTKKSQLYHTTLSGVDESQSLQCVIQCDEVDVWRRRDQQCLIKRHVRRTSPALLIMARAGKIGQNPPHQLCANSEEMGAVLPIDPPDIDQPQINFINKCGCLESVAGAFARDVPLRRPV